MQTLNIYNFFKTVEIIINKKCFSIIIIIIIVYFIFFVHELTVNVFGGSLPLIIVGLTYFCT